MKNANLVLRAQRLLPEVYSDESRDFQLFTKLMDSVYNGVQFNAETIKYLNDARNIDDSLLTLLADKFGIEWKDAETLTDNEVRYILRSLPELLRNKGSLKAITGLINMYFKIYHISGKYEISIANKSAVVQDITLSERTIILGLETLKQSTRMLTIMAKYLLPPGYTFFVYFFSEMASETRDELEENMTLLYRSTNLGNIIDQEIPDFIFNAEYSWSEEYPMTRSARANQFISAVDLQQLNSIVSRNDRTKFIGFIYENQLDAITSEYIRSFDESKKSEYKYDESKEEQGKYNNLDIVYFEDQPNSRYIYTYEQLFHSTLESEEEKRKSRLYNWHLLGEGSLTIANSIIETEDCSETGDIYYFSNNEWHKLHFYNSFELENSSDFSRRELYLPNPETQEVNNWDYCCLLTKELPFLFKKELKNEIVLNQKPAVSILPINTSLYELRYNTTTNKYYYANKEQQFLNMLMKENFAESCTISGVTFLLSDSGSFIIDGIATDNIDFMAYKKPINFIENHKYLIYGCPNFKNNGKNSLQIISMDTKKTFDDFGNGCVFQATKDNMGESLIGDLRIHIEKSTNIIEQKFIPVLIDLTDKYTEGHEPQSLQDIIDMTWTQVNEGTTMYEQSMKLNYNNTIDENLYSPEDNTVFWKRSGDYYIYNNAWKEYTEPLFFTKLIQIRNQ